jgi:hypothetical protein
MEGASFAGLIAREELRRSGGDAVVGGFVSAGRAGWLVCGVAVGALTGVFGER